ncbi:Bacterial extracellular solute-binding protein [Bifidobacterium avesanii]|nr:Bacterial extracellular solute-binding protein [Bifidobacterium avesanii]
MAVMVATVTERSKETKMTGNTWRRVIPAAIAAMTMALAGCGGTGGSGGGTAEVKPSEGNVTLRLNWWGGDKRVKLTEQAVELFEQKHPNITVETEYSDWNGYWDKLATSAAGGEVADVIQMSDFYIASYASQGSLYDMGVLGEYLDLSTMNESVRQAGQVNGKQYSAPISIAGHGVVVNNDILDKYGVKLPDTDTWSWSDFENVAKQVTQKSGGEVVGAYAPPYLLTCELWARQHGEEFFKDGKVAVSAETLGDFLNLAKRWADEGVSGSTDAWVENANATMEQSAFATGKQAMAVVASNQLTVYQAAAGTENISIVQIPSDDQSVKWESTWSSLSWAISAKTEHPAEAAMLVDFLVNDEDAGKILGNERGDPANNAIRASLTASATGGTKEGLEFTDKLIAASGPATETVPNGASSAEKEIARAMQNVAFGKATPTEAANELITTINNEIASAS